jgi:hypothetical protein
VGSELHPTASESRPSCGVDSMNRRPPLPASDALRRAKAVGSNSACRACRILLPLFVKRPQVLSLPHGL